jgi:hypothetical protein
MLVFFKRGEARRLTLGVTPQAKGNPETPGSGGAPPYLRRNSRVYQSCITPGLQSVRLPLLAEGELPLGDDHPD